MTFSKTEWHAIEWALRIAAQRFEQNAEASASLEHVAKQFKDQADTARRLARRIEETF